MARIDRAEAFSVGDMDLIVTVFAKGQLKCVLIEAIMQ